MIISIANVLDREVIDEARAELARATFVDGKTTAGWSARLVKENLQARKTDAVARLGEKLVEKLASNDVFALAVRPKTFTPLIFSRYGAGHAYGSHVDDAVMGGLRTDVSFTLFLADPESYDGGELVIETAGGEEHVKLPAGAVVAYPSSSLHRVAEVTRGERLVAVGWVRSLIRDAGRRELLFDLDTARRRLFERNGKSADFDLLSKCTANLIRMWAED